MPSGIITKGIGGFYYVSSEGGLYECKARGVFRKDKLTPLPGDRVSFSIADEIKKIGSIDIIMPRESCLVRPQVVNVNQVVIVIAAKSPYPDFLLLDKLLVTVEEKGLCAVVCINKIDLDPEEGYKDIVGSYKSTGYKFILTSIKTGVGFEQFKNMLKGKVTVFAGQSGVGKSTILNNIMNSNVMETGEVSRKIERGRHTTRHAELIELEQGGYVADTPGFSSFEISNIRYYELYLYYPEFAGYVDGCRFTRCSHISEPECAVKGALASGFIDRGRYDRYVQLYNILKKNREY